MLVGWTWAFDTPFKWTKQIASHFGGTRQGIHYRSRTGLVDAPELGTVHPVVGGQVELVVDRRVVGHVDDGELLIGVVRRGRRRVIGLTEEEKAALVAFLKTLSDPGFLSGN